MLATEDHIEARPSKHGEKKRESLFSFYAYLEDNPGFTYQIRSWIESGFIVKRNAVCRELDLKEWILDIACGEGFIREVIPSEKYIGIDLSLPVIRHARSKKGGYLIPMSASTLGFRDASVENCMALDMFHHIPDQGIFPILAEIKRVLKKGGHFLVIDPVRAGFFQNPLHSMMQAMDRGNYFRSQEELGRILSQYFSVKSATIGRSSFIRWSVFVLTH